MVEDKISLVLKDINKLKDELRSLKRDMREDEKIDRADYLELKKTYKELREQIKDIENEEESELHKDEAYNKMREMKINLEEDIALARQKLFELVAQMPAKFFQMSIETETGPVKVTIQPEMKVYQNGKEEKGK